jgi:hypothetical protein
MKLTGLFQANPGISLKTLVSWKRGASAVLEFKKVALVVAPPPATMDVFYQR